MRIGSQARPGAYAEFRISLGIGPGRAAADPAMMVRLTLDDECFDVLAKVDYVRKIRAGALQAIEATGCPSIRWRTLAG